MKKIIYLMLIIHCTLTIDNCLSQTQFQRAIGGTDDDYANSIIQTTDGGYAVAGTTRSFGAGNDDFYIVKFDGSGTLQWSRTVGGTNVDEARSIIQTTDGGYAVAGFANFFGGGLVDFYIVKLAGSGTLQWSKTVGGTNWDYGYSIIQTTDGGYAVAGFTSSSITGPTDMYIVKLDAGGNLQWTRTVGGTNFDEAYSIIQTTDGGYAVAGLSRSFGGMYIVKLDAGGALQWSRTVGGGVDQAYSIIRTTDGGYAVAGTTGSFGAGGYDMYIVKFDASWNTCGNTNSPSSTVGTGGTLGSPTPIISQIDPTVTTPTPPTNIGGTVTTLCFVGIQPNSNEIPASFALHQNYPNPFNPNTKIKFDVPQFPLIKGGGAERRGLFVSLKIYDLLGSEVAALLNEQLTPGTYEAEWNASNYPSGIYFYTLTASGYSRTKRMILVK